MRGKKILAISHCCLNQNSVLFGWERAKGAYPFAEIIIIKNIGIIQIPCPELLSFGVDRKPMNYDEYNTDLHRKLCREICKYPIDMILGHSEAGDIFLGTVGIKGSPNCSISGQRGVLMEEFFSELEKRKLSLNYIEVPEEYSESDVKSLKNFDKVFNDWIDKILGA